jgi:predicted membrane channel-forming protein YqfA (hemolysin III family)
MVEHQLIPR